MKPEPRATKFARRGGPVIADLVDALVPFVDSAGFPFMSRLASPFHFR